MNCRILYLVGQLGAGGLERQLYLLLQSIDRERYRPAVAVWNFSETDLYVPHIRSLNVPIYNFAGVRSRSAKLNALRRLVRNLRPEVLHSYTFYTNFAASWAALATPTIAVGAVQSDFINEKKLCGVVLGRLSALWPRNQIYNNHAAAEAARSSRTLFAPKEIFVVQNGLDVQRFTNARMPIGSGAHILGVGSLLSYKRWDRLLNAAFSLKQRGLAFTMQIAGGGPLRESLEQQAAVVGVADRVSFTGHSDDVPSLLAQSSLLAHTSDLEGCPNAVMEAMACGRAVVATDVGEIPALVIDGVTGFIVPRGNGTQLVERLSTLISNPELCRHMGEAGRLRAERQFGLERFVNEIFAAYRAAGWRQWRSVQLATT